MVEVQSAWVGKAAHRFASFPKQAEFGTRQIRRQVGAGRAGCANCGVECPKFPTQPAFSYHLPPGGFVQMRCYVCNQKLKWTERGWVHSNGSGKLTECLRCGWCGALSALADECPRCHAVGFLKTHSPVPVPDNTNGGIKHGN